MARPRLPAGKVSRRLGIAISEKGARVLARTPSPPGAHGRVKRKFRISEHGKRLLEKQKARFLYGLTERQFRNLFDQALRMPGSTGDNLMSLLERRFDNVAYRLGLGSTRRQARQLVSHGHLPVDGRVVDVPSFQAKPGQVTGVRPSRWHLIYFQNLLAAGRLKQVPVPGWLERVPTLLGARVVRNPERGEAEPIDAPLIIEYYSR